MCDGRYIGNFYGSCSDYAIHEGTYYTCSKKNCYVTLCSSCYSYYVEKKPLEEIMSTSPLTNKGLYYL